MNYLKIILIISIAQITGAQTIYKDSIYKEVKKYTYSYQINENDTLKFDYYRAGGNKELRPILVFVHGGGFSGGSRDSEDVVEFANKLAQRGYAVASVSYRLTMKDIGFGCNVLASEKINAFNSASQDVSFAIKYIINNDDKLSIDISKIIIAGSSAGAETVLNMAYVYENEILPNDFKYAGVISFAGAITSLDKINIKKAIPTQLFHGTGDELVPYNIAPHHYCNSRDDGYIMLYGSKPIANRLKGLGSSYYLYTVLGGSHDWAGLPMKKSFEDIVDFLYNDIVNVKSNRQTHRIIN